MTSRATTAAPAMVGPLRLVIDGAGHAIGHSDTARIGSGAGAHIRSDAPGVELSHATVRVEDGQWILRDHSRTGVWADGRLIVKLRLDGPMAVRLGAPDGPLLALDTQPISSESDDSDVGSNPKGRRPQRRTFGRARGRHFRR